MNSQQQQQKQYNPHSFFNVPYHQTVVTEKVPQQQARHSFKRRRDSSSSNNYESNPLDPASFQNSFKRLRVMDDHHGDLKPQTARGSAVVGLGGTFSLDEASLADEEPPSAKPTLTVCSHQSSFVARYPQKVPSLDKSSVSLQNQTPGQLSSELPCHSSLTAAAAGCKLLPRSTATDDTSHLATCTDYQPMNSLLGNLHMMRRRERHGTGQSFNHQSHHHEQQQQSEHPTGMDACPNDNGPLFRPKKKTVVSLRIDSNIY